MIWDTNIDLAAITITTLILRKNNRLLVPKKKTDSANIIFNNDINIAFFNAVFSKPVTKAIDSIIAEIEKIVNATHINN